MNLRRALPLPLLRLHGEISYWRRALPAEWRSLLRRIGELHDKRKGPEDVPHLPLYRDSASGCSGLSLQTIAHSSSIQILNASYPELSDGDVLMALAGWNLGAQYGLYISGSEGRSIAPALASVQFMDEYEAITERVLEGIKNQTLAGAA